MNSTDSRSHQGSVLVCTASVILSFTCTLVIAQCAIKIVSVMLAG